MKEIIRPDFIFSYWIFAWVVLYIAHLVTIAPKFLLIGGSIENLIFLLILIYKKSSFYSIFRFIFINIWIKAIPLYIVWNKKITVKEIIYSVLLFLVYVVWLYINDYDLYGIYNKVYNVYTKSVKYITSLSYLYDKTYEYITQ